MGLQLLCSQLREARADSKSLQPEHSVALGCPYAYGQVEILPVLGSSDQLLPPEGSGGNRKCKACSGSAAPETCPLRSLATKSSVFPKGNLEGKSITTKAFKNPR